eukprot:463683-Karenia_brevis.AAC.1
MNFPGTNFTQSHLSTVEPSPVPGGGPGRGQDFSFAPVGPIGLLLQHTHYFAASIDIHNHSLHRYQHPEIFYIDIPLQIFKPFILKLAFDAVHRHVSTTRSYIKDLPCFDSNIFLSALPKDDKH